MPGKASQLRQPQPATQRLRRSRVRGGFTLLEVLTAVAMMSVLSLALYSTLHIAFRARAAAERRLQPMHQLATSLDMVAAELKTALPITGMLAFEFLGQSDEHSPGMASDTILFTNTRTYLPWADHDTGFREVEILLQRDPETDAWMLVRQTRLTTIAPVRPEPDELIICRDVRSFEARYFDGSTWREEWDSEAEGQLLPYAVQLTLELMPDDHQQHMGESGPTMTIVVALANAEADGFDGASGGQIRRR